MDAKFLKPYNPQDTEDRVYSLWEESGLFNPDKAVASGIIDKNAEPFSIVLPPPNVTGTLHMGHAAMLAVQDIIIRFNRMCGRRTLWLPGTDHAAIATESKVEDMLYKKEKKARRDLGRDLFLERAKIFAKESHDTIVHQIKKMGSSLDWSREAYTLDEKRHSAVNAAFVRMYEAGLVYRGARIVNWDPKMQTTVSDEEVVYKERVDKFYYLKYGPFVIGTARPETKFGDKYVVMHPRDERYKKYKHGQQLELEWINGPVVATVIKDEAADPEVGTGVMTITPWHDMTDFEIAERHGLEKEQIIDWNGKLLSIAREFEGEHISKAREKIVEKLKKKGLIERVDEKYMHNVATAQRGGGTIEPQVKEQWWIAVKKDFILPHSTIEGIPPGSSVTLQKILQETVRSGQIKILPGRFEKNYFHWIDNLRDWCISRQIWFGHRIPVWYRSADAHGKPNGTPSANRGMETYVGTEPPEGSGWRQDEDTLDTWFSSALWTFSTLGWPLETEDLATYHPTDILETGYDILFFWVARMILMSGFHLGTIPFHTVYLHGLVRDEKGRKMSKSLGNIIDPLDMIKKYGADATRLSLIIGIAPGNDNKLSEDRVRGYKNFANKVWNISRFVLLNTDGLNFSERPRLGKKEKEWLSEFETVSNTTTEYIKKYRLDLAADCVYQFVWHRFADVILEESKAVLGGTDENAKTSVGWTLYTILTGSLKLLHPFMPFVTEEIWQALPEKGQELLMVASWPKKSL